MQEEEFVAGLTLDTLKERILLLINESEKTMVSTIYTTYVRPFCETGGESFSEFLIPKTDIFQAPPKNSKIRLFLYQIMTQLDVYAENGSTDPLPDDEYGTIVFLVRAISPLASALGVNTLIEFMRELQSTHRSQFPLTMDRLLKDLGIENKTLILEEFEGELDRVHYKDADKEEKKEVQPNPLQAMLTSTNGLFRNRSSALERTVRLRIKKSKIMPDNRSDGLLHKK